MLSPEQIDSLPENVSVLYAKLEEQIVSDMARRIVKTNMATAGAQWQFERLRALGLCEADIMARVAKQANRSQKEVRDMFKEAAKIAYGSDAARYRKAGKTPIPLEENAQLQRIISAGLKKTNNLFENLTRTTAKTENQRFENVLDTAYMQITSGAFDYNTAIRTAIKTLAQDGIDAIRYPSGHTDKLDVAVRRAALTGVNQTALRMQDELANEMDCDLVMTSAHFGARPEHAEWQGKIFSRSGTSHKYPHFQTATGYGTGAGLGGWNCRHSFYPYFEGTPNPYTAERLREMEARTVEYNGEKIPEYEATQKQRAMERRIRATKRELAGYDSAIQATEDESLKEALQADFERKSVVLKRQEAKLKDFVSRTGLRRERAREQVLGFGRSTSQKAVQANRKAISNYRRASDIIQVLPKEKGDTFKPENLVKGLKKSDVGKEALEYIKSENIDVKINYNPEITEDGLMGRTYGKHIDIFGLNTKTKKETVKTIIHEVTHIKYDVGGDMWAEAFCEAKALLHEKGVLTLQDKRDIIKSVKSNYSTLKWRDKSGRKK